MLLFTLGVSLTTGSLFGLAPAWKASRIAVHGGLRESGCATVNRHRLWFDKALVTGQVALSATLLMGAGLFVHTLVNLNRAPLGFESNHIMLFRLSLPRARYNDGQMTAFFERLEEKLASLPGVRSVTANNIGIIGDGHSGSTFHVLGRPLEEDPVRVQTNGAGAEFFQTLGIAILRGRAFDRHDTAASPKVAVVNRTLAEKFFPNENPIGKTFEAEVVNGTILKFGLVDAGHEVPTDTVLAGQVRQRIASSFNGRRRRCAQSEHLILGLASLAKRNR